MERAFVDTSAWFAYANREDPDHQRIRNVLQTFQGRLLTSNFIFDETVTLACIVWAIRLPPRLARCFSIQRWWP